MKLDWSRVKGLLDELKFSVRRGLAAQVLMGKELSSLKRKLGFTHGGNRWKDGQISAASKTWDQWCQDELGKSYKTADRWISCFHAAIERAKRHKKTEPEALRLLSIPADELDGNELEALAACVDRLVDNDTQAGLLEELGIVKPSGLRDGGASAPRTHGELTLEVISGFFLNGFDATAKMLKTAGRFMSDCDFDAYLHQLPLVGTETEAGQVVGLLGLKTALEDLHAKFLDAEERLQATVKKTEAAIEASMISVGPKSRPRKTKAKEGKR